MLLTLLSGRSVAERPISSASDDEVLVEYSRRTKRSSALRTKHQHTPHHRWRSQGSGIRVRAPNPHTATEMSTTTETAKHKNSGEKRDAQYSDSPLPHSGDIVVRHLSLFLAFLTALIERWLRLRGNAVIRDRNPRNQSASGRICLAILRSAEFEAMAVRHGSE